MGACQGAAVVAGVLRPPLLAWGVVEEVVVGHRRVQPEEEEAGAPIQARVEVVGVGAPIQARVEGAGELHALWTAGVGLVGAGASLP